MNQMHKKTNTTGRRMIESETAGSVWATASSVKTKVQIPINDGNPYGFCLWVMPDCLSGPLRAVAHLLRELWLTSQEMSPATSINLSPLRAVPWRYSLGCGPQWTTAARTGDYYCYSHFTFFKRGEAFSTLLRCRLSQMPDEIKCDWRGPCSWQWGTALKWVNTDNEGSVIKMMWRARPEHTTALG